MQNKVKIKRLLKLLIPKTLIIFLFFEGIIEILAEKKETPKTSEKIDFTNFLVKK